MKGLGKKFEKLMMAVTFAEAGEHETAREIMREDDEHIDKRADLSKRPQKGLRASPPMQ